MLCISPLSPVYGVPVWSTYGNELPGHGNGSSEQVLPLLYPWVQEALLTEQRIDVPRNLNGVQVAK